MHTQLPTLLLITLTLHFPNTALAFPHALPFHLTTHHTSYTFHFRRSSIHFPLSSSASQASTPNFRSFLPVWNSPDSSLLPSHDTPSKRQTTPATPTSSPTLAKPFSFTIWNILSNPAAAFNNTPTNTSTNPSNPAADPHSPPGGREPTLAELSIFSGPGGHGKKGRMVNGKGTGKKRTFGFLRGAMPWDLGSDVDVEGPIIGVTDVDIEESAEDTMVDDDVKKNKKRDGEHSSDVKELKEDNTESKDSKHSHKDKDFAHKNARHVSEKPSALASGPPLTPLRVSMAGFKSWFDDAKVKEEGIEGPASFGSSSLGMFQNWFGMGSEDREEKKD